MLPRGPRVGDQDLSPFYEWTQALPGAPGVLLRQEPMPAGLMPPHASQGTRLLYSSTDGRWNTGMIPVSGALYLPSGIPAAGGWPLILWAHGTVGIADSCAPSWSGSNERDRAYIDKWLAAGFAVVAPDYQGLGGPGPHAYTQWRAEGQSSLDSVRVALAMNLPVANRIVITGQSQGSGASLAAARLSSSYAPELHIVGAIATALLATFPERARTATPSPEDSPHFWIYRIVGGGLPDGSPAADELLTAKGKVLLEAILQGCSPRPIAEREGITNANAFADAADLDRKLGPIGAQTQFKVKFPLMVGTGLADELVSPVRQREAVAALCSYGNTVAWKRYPGANHSGTLLASFEDAERFARSVLASGLIDSQCGTLDSTP